MTTKETIFAQLDSVFSHLEKLLDEQEQKDLNVSVKTADMISKISAHTSLDVKTVDNAVRLYLRTDEKWTITPGANGGIRLRSSIKSKAKKFSTEAMDEVKRKCEAVLAASKLAKQNSDQALITTVSQDNHSEDNRYDDGSADDYDDSDTEEFDDTL